MNDEPERDAEEELAILAVMQTPEFQRIKSEEGRKRFFKLASAYWDIAPARRRKGKLRAVS